MPISPERARLYPPDWPEIRARILARAGNRCEWCGVGNAWIGIRDGDAFRHLTPKEAEASKAEGARLTRIVLTIAHLDHDPRNNDPGNLCALCQACHLRHDAKEHATHAAETRRRRAREAGQVELL